MVVQGKSRIHQDRLPLSLTAKFHRHATCLGAIRARHRSTRSARCGEHYSVFERAPPSQHSEPRRVQEKLSLLATDRNEPLREQSVYEAKGNVSSRYDQDNSVAQFVQILRFREDCQRGRSRRLWEDVSLFYQQFHC